MRTATDRALGIMAAAAWALLLGGCAGMASEGMPLNMPIAGQKIAAIHKGMTYAEFQTAFGDGWLSQSSGTDSKYWFFDDGRTIVVPSDVWKSPAQPLSYRIIGIMPLAEKMTIPVLQPKEEITVTTRGTR